MWGRDLWFFWAWKTMIYWVETIHWNFKNYDLLVEVVKKTIKCFRKTMICWRETISWNFKSLQKPWFTGRSRAQRSMWTTKNHDLLKRNRTLEYENHDLLVRVVQKRSHAPLKAMKISWIFMKFWLNFAAKKMYALNVYAGDVL